MLGRERVLTEIKTRELLSDVLERVTGEGLRVFTVRQWLAVLAERDFLFCLTKWSPCVTSR